MWYFGGMDNSALIGKTFNRLKIIALSGGRPSGKKITAVCICKCGRRVTRLKYRVVSGNTKSCGCLRIDTPNGTKHGMEGSRIYHSWAAMIQRCENKNNPAWTRYGGRGIAVCKRWRNSFECFAKDMGQRPLNMSLDRINNNRGYFPKNCRWATRWQQSANRRTVRIITFKGKAKSVAGWASEIKINYWTLRSRLLKYKWSAEKALTAPLRATQG